MTRDELLRVIAEAERTGATELDLSGNDLTALPPEIGRLTQLETLVLGKWDEEKREPIGNQLSSLPPEIVQLTRLETLYLSDNQLSSLPPEIQQLPNLKSLDLRGNPLPIAPEILGPKESYEKPGDISTILELYFAIQDPDATESLYEAKFLIVGEGGAGKTSLAKKIQNPDYKLDPEEDSTHGIEVIQWRFPMDDDQDFRVNLWDFGGQEIYHQTHQFFLTDRSLYALVADTRKEDTDFSYWLNCIELFGGDSPVLVIKNEKHDRPCNINEKQLRGEFDHVKDFYPTNLSDGRGLDEIKDAIRYYITKLDYVGTPLPKKWVRVRYTLENDSRNTISQYDYFTLCQGNGVTDRAEMLRISDFLHKLGICLHFQADKVLKHVVILRPEWATNAVYAVTKNKAVIAAKGQFTRDQLDDIWGESEYVGMGDELLQLMENFRLCYPIPGLQDHYIAPQLLEQNPPDYDWDNSHNLLLRYEYEFMPKGIITQLIVRLHRWIEDQQLVWRSGVVFNNGRARAEVIETYRSYKGEIRVRVFGVHNKELLSVVTNEVDQINASFEKIEVTKKIPCICEECQVDKDPHFFRLQTLDRYLEKKRYDIPCEKSCLDVPVRRLTAVLIEPNLETSINKKESEQREFERLKQQHTEYHPNSHNAQPMADSKYVINAQNVQINERIEQGDAVIHKYASDPKDKAALNTVLTLLQDLQQQHPNAALEEAGAIFDASILDIQQTQPDRWQSLLQQLRNLPRDLRDRERLLQASKSTLVQVTTDLTDNVFLNAVIAFLDGLSAEPS